MGNISLIEKILRLNKSPKFPELGMFYGSRKEESDVDLFLIFSGIPVEKNIINNNLDLSQIEKNDFIFRLINWDIEYTEPILTGEHIFGDKTLLEKSKEFLAESKPNKENLDYLCKRSLETYLQAKTVYSLGKNELFNKLIEEGENSKDIISKFLDGKDFTFNSSQILKSLSLLTYSLSYLSAKERYLKGCEVITLNELIENPNSESEKELRNLMKYFKTKSKDNQKMRIPEINNYFLKTKKLLSKDCY